MSRRMSIEMNPNQLALYINALANEEDKKPVGHVDTQFSYSHRNQTWERFSANLSRMILERFAPLALDAHDSECASVLVEKVMDSIQATIPSGSRAFWSSVKVNSFCDEHLSLERSFEGINHYRIIITVKGSIIRTVSNTFWFQSSTFDTKLVVKVKALNVNIKEFDAFAKKHALPPLLGHDYLFS